MKTINSKVGTLYMETWTEKRSDPEKVKIYDSKHRLYDCVAVEIIEEMARFEGVTPQEFLDNIAKDIKEACSVVELLNVLEAEYLMLSVNWQDIADYLNDGETKTDSLEKLLENKWVAVIGNYYILMLERSWL